MPNAYDAALSYALYLVAAHAVSPRRAARLAWGRYLSTTTDLVALVADCTAEVTP